MATRCKNCEGTNVTVSKTENRLSIDMEYDCRDCGEFWVKELPKRKQEKVEREELVFEDDDGDIQDLEL